MTILDNTFSEVEGGVYAQYVDDLIVGGDGTGNSMSNSAGTAKKFGVFVEHGSDVYIHDNDIEGFAEGIDLGYVTQFEVYRNSVVNENNTVDAKGIYISESTSTSSYAVVCNDIWVKKNGVVNRAPAGEDADNFVVGGTGLANKISIHDGSHYHLFPDPGTGTCGFMYYGWDCSDNWNDVQDGTGDEPSRSGDCNPLINYTPYYTGSFNPATMQSLCGIVE